MAAPLDTSEIVERLWTKSQAQTLNSSRSDHFYTGAEQTKNFYVEFNFPENKINKPLVIVTGLEDPIPLWFDFVLKAKEFGYKKIYIVELRGQGRSQRVPGNSDQLIHVNKFSHYHEDLVAAFVDIDKKGSLSTPLHIISHSTGSMILLQSQRKIQKEIPHLKIEKMSLWAPLVILNISPYLNNFVVRPALNFSEKLYSSCCGLLVGRKYGPCGFEGNGLTSDQNKFSLMEKIKFEFGLGSTGVSLRWGLSALQAARNFPLLTRLNSEARANV